MALKKVYRGKAGKRFRVLLSSCGNPDFGQHAPISTPEARDADSLAGLRAQAEDYRDYWNLGGGNWNDGRIIDNRTGKLVGHFSYNLRCWEGLPGTWTSETKEIKSL